MAGFRWFQVFPGWFQLVLAGFNWFQMVSGGFRSFLAIVSTNARQEKVGLLYFLDLF